MHGKVMGQCSDNGHDCSSLLPFCDENRVLRGASSPKQTNFKMGALWQVFFTILQFSFIYLQKFLFLIQFLVIYPGYPGYGQESWDILVLGQKQSTVELPWSCLYSRAHFSIKLLDRNVCQNRNAKATFNLKQSLWVFHILCLNL